MTQEIEQRQPEQEGGLGSCLLWFFWGGSLSFLTILSLTLMVLLAGSIALNIYQAWQMAGLEVSVSRRGTESGPPAGLIAPRMLAGVPTQTPAAAVPATPMPEPLPTESPLDSQVATLSALATAVAGSPPAPAPELALLPTNTPVPPTETATPVNVSPAVPIDPPPGADQSGPAPQIQPAPPATAAPEREAAPAADAPAKPTTAAMVAEEAPAEEAQAFSPPSSSSNSYELIPINGEMDRRPPEEHGDLNLKLREPTLSDVPTELVDETEGVDPDAPNLGSVFEPDLVATYAIHDWDWGCNCKGDLLPEEEAVLVGIDTQPGEPIFIPKKEQDVYGGDIYAVVLYASEDSLTFVYAREGSVVRGYTVHYLGLHTDPNLLALYQEESSRTELPGLTLDTPVGVASEELIVAIRDNGKFLDARSLRDWWD